MFSEYSTNVPYSGSVTSRTATLHPLFKRKMKTFLPKPKKTMKRRYFVVARSKVGGIGTDSNDANILIERLKRKTRTKKVKPEKVEKVKVTKQMMTLSQCWKILRYYYQTTKK